MVLTQPRRSGRGPRRGCRQNRATRPLVGKRHLGRLGLVGRLVDFRKAVSGGLQLMPTGAALGAFERDYAAMLDDGLLSLHQPSFDEIMAN